MEPMNGFLLILFFYILYTKFFRFIAYKIGQHFGIERFINSLILHKNN